ncbi:Sel1 domain protein repeat-containing protein [Acidithiobacillus ferrivorans SS3]|jgi:TPR repeat protein|uniref:Sel1 domain protein repeat-containing protein n=2 Tax=Acidithiobacillus ferrivorans TaxID=160808 RepID=G0JSA2_9PROT|nr:Sel1 domain protein repeat-containing protein [Acidithiobacillus ferrivorans SS3]
MDMSNNSPAYISTQTAALLAGKSVRTINNWLESGSISGKRVHAERGPGGLMWKIDLSSMAAYIPMEMADACVQKIMQAEEGDADGMNHVGTYFYAANACKIAADWFEAAAKKGHADAMEWLSICYLNGIGVEKNHALGIQWLGKAAALGHSVAKAKLRALGFEL